MRRERALTAMAVILTAVCWTCFCLGFDLAMGVSGVMAILCVGMSGNGSKDNGDETSEKRKATP